MGKELTVKKANNKVTGKRYLKKNPTLKEVVKEVRSLQKKQDKLGELKHFDNPWSTSVSTSPLIYQMDLIADGDSEVTRTGIVVSPERLDFYLRLTTENPLTTGDSNIVRVIVFRWFDSSFPTVNDLLYDNTSGIWTGYPYIDIPTVWDKKPKFQVLSDKRIILDEDDSDHSFYMLKKKFRKGSTIHYSGPSPSDIESKNIFFMIMSDSGVVPHPIFSGYSRLTYRDL